ncbi:MAG: N-acetylglucosamine-6-phosphate deacetylase [Rhodobacteraceae bacterium]|nr:N-acetylglucosamine-6-phosphate deacetylase [Paracoccaceae bacterium]MBR9822280.1 N-acetylglucosamine-6-phosphate deacetylase [Paracoccaceae bacterium]
MADRIILRAGALHDGFGGAPRHDRALVIEDGCFVEEFDGARAAALGGQLIEAEVVAPGFIDLQLNGAGGVLFNDAPLPESLRTMAEGARRGGTAYFLPTFITDAGRKYQRAMEAVRAAARQLPEVIGLHLEGPFLSPARPGIHPADCIRPMADEDLAHLTQFDLPLMLTLAPEEAAPGQVAALARAGVRVFAGHSEGRFEDIAAAEDEGLSGATHLFNAMSQVAGRAPGVVGAVLDSGRLAAGIIADGQHVHPANLRLALARLGAGRLFLVTDAMSPLGTDVTEFDLLGKRIYRRDGRLSDANGVLAGADLSMIEAVRQMDALTGCGLGAAIRMASLTPAEVMGLGDSLGSVTPGKRAGLTLMDAELQVTAVMVDGQMRPA